MVLKKKKRRKRKKKKKNNNNNIYGFQQQRGKEVLMEEGGLPPLPPLTKGSPRWAPLCLKTAPNLKIGILHPVLRTFVLAGFLSRVKFNSLKILNIL